MEQQNAEKTILDCLQPIYGFMLQKTATTQDAEDLTQETALRGYRALLSATPDDPGAFLWRVARNALANYYRGKTRSGIGIPLDELSETPDSGEDDIADILARRESCVRIQKEIAYLGKLQRQILIAHYYDGLTTAQIAKRYHLPAGTVMWHLYEARKSLKKGMETMRNATELKFNPIKFTSTSFAGSLGKQGYYFLRSSLSQNIAYDIYREAKTVAQIADDLGVSPVYVEDEAEYLTEYGFLTKTGNKYLTNFLIKEVTPEILRLRDEMYTKAAHLVGFDLFDELMKSDLLDDSSLYFPDGDKNFMMWGLLPYLLERSMRDEEAKIKFQDVATLRPDGGQNIFCAYIENNPQQNFTENMHRFSGPLWKGNEHMILWQTHSEWASWNFDPNAYQNSICRDMNLLFSFCNSETLSKEDYAYLAQKGYIRGENGNFDLAVIRLKDDAIKDKLLALGKAAKDKHALVLSELKTNYKKTVEVDTPLQVKKMQAFEMQFLFDANGFLFYTLKELLADGRLKLPTEIQRRSLSTVILPAE